MLILLNVDVNYLVRLYLKHNMTNYLIVQRATSLSDLTFAEPIAERKFDLSTYFDRSLVELWSK